MKIRLYFKLRRDIILNFRRLKQCSYLEALKEKVTQNKNGKNVPYLEENELILAHSNFVTILINKIQEIYIHLFQIIHLFNH